MTPAPTAPTEFAPGLSLVTHNTRNTREFGRVPGLPLANWFDDSATQIS